MKNKKRFIVVAIQIFAVIFFVFSYQSYMKPVKVYQFSRDLEEQHQITEKDLQVMNTKSYSSNMILSSNISDIIGRYTTSKVYKDTYCYYDQLGDLEADDNFSSLDLSNSRLISIPVNLQTDAGGDFESGDRIDLVFNGTGTTTTTVGEEEKQEEFYYAKDFMQDIVVYQVLNGNGFKFTKRADRLPGETASNLDLSEDSEVNVDDSAISCLVLVVTPEQAEQIKARQMVGSLTILKRFDESQTHETLGFVIGNYGKVFSGNANAETGSLQIISTLEDSDSSDNTLNQTTTDSNGNNTNTAGSTSVSNSNSTNGSNSASDSASDTSDVTNAATGTSGAD